MKNIEKRKLTLKNLEEAVEIYQKIGYPSLECSKHAKIYNPKKLAFQLFSNLTNEKYLRDFEIFPYYLPDEGINADFAELGFVNK